MATIELNLRDNVSAGAKAAAEALSKVATAGDAATASVQKVSDSTSRALPTFTSVNKKLDESAQLAAKVAAANKTLATQMQVLDDQVKKNLITQDQYNKLSGNANADRDNSVQRAKDAVQRLEEQRAGLIKLKPVMADAEKSSNALGYAQRQLSIQFVQGASGIATGQPILQTLIQQGHQVYDSMESAGTGVSGLGQAFKGMIAPLFSVGGAFAAVVGVAGLLGYAVEQQSTKLLALQNALRGTREDYVSMAAEATAAARAVAASQNISLPNASAAANAIAGSPNFHGSSEQLQALIVSAANLQAINGTTFQEFANGIDHVGQFALTLAQKQLPGMTMALADTIKQMETAGNTSGAFAKVLEIINHDSSGAITNLTEIQRAMLGLSKAFSDTGDNGTSVGKIIGSVVDTAVVGAIGVLTSLVKEFKQIYDLLSSLKAPTSYAVEQNQSLLSFAWDMTDETKLAAFIAGRYTKKTAPVTVAPSIAPAIDSAAQQNGLDPQFLSRLQISENSAPDAHGNWATSSAGAVGPMQIKPETFAGIISQPGVFPTAAGLNNIHNPAQNVQAGAALLGHMLSKYGDPRVALWAYHDGEPLIDQMLASGGLVSPSKDAITQANKVLTGYAGTGRIAPSIADASLPTPPLPPGADGSGVFTTSQQNVDKAIADAEAAGATAKAFADATAKVREFQGALDDIGTGKATATGDKVNELAEGLQKAETAMYNAIPAMKGLIREDELQIRAAQDLADAQLKGAAAVTLATAQDQARSQVLAKGITPASKDYAAALKIQTQELLKVQEAQSLGDFNKTLKATEDQTGAQLRINAAWDGSATSLMHLQDVERATAQVQAEGLSKDTPEYTRRVNALTAAFDKSSAAVQTFQQEQASVNALSGAFSTAFSTIGNAITQAFISGQGAAVNWGNVIRAVISQVIQKFAELAILNPLLNSLFGQSNGSLSTAFAVLGRSGGTGADGIGAAATGGQSGGGLGIIGNLSSLYNTGKSLFTGGLTSLSAGIDSFGASVAPSLFATSATNGAAGLTDAATGAVGQLGAVGSFSNVLGGAGAGFAAGSFAGGLVQNSLGKTGPAPTIGAGVGAIGGAILGQMLIPIPVVGALIGGVVGGLLGGSGGGLIGPGKKNAYSQEVVSTEGGNLSISKVLSQLVDTTAEVNKLQAQLTETNAFVNANKISITGQTEYSQFGTNTPGKYVDPSKFADLYSANVTGTTAFSKYNFQSSNPDLQAIIGDKHFQDLSQLQGVVTFITQTVPALLALGKPTTTAGSLTTTLSTLNTEFAAAVTTAANLGRATADLSTAWTTAVRTANKAVEDVFVKLDQGFTGRFYAAQASISGLPADQKKSDLYGFDLQAQGQRDALKAQFVSIYGDAVVGTKHYNEQMVALENALGAERLAIQVNYDKQITSAASSAVQSTISNIVSFATGLPYSAASPLNPQSQLALARRTFNADASKAQGGDYTAISSITNDSTALLNASKAVFGSGAVYTNDFNRVVNVLSSITSLPADTLTASAMAVQTQTQTVTLVKSLETLRVELVNIKLQLKQSATIPAQLAA